MKLVGKLAILSVKELDRALKDAEQNARERGEAGQKRRVEELSRSVDRKSKEIINLQERVEDLNGTVEVYEEKRDEVRKVAAERIEVEDLKSLLEAKKKGLDEREAKLKDRLKAVEDEESKAAKNSYADGLADGLRKAHEITAKDRENAMKIAMVSAASHSTPESVKEATNALQLSDGRK